MTRPELVVVVTGTGTEVGKTWVGAELARRICAGDGGIELTVIARKPAQSYAPGERTDAEILAGATGEEPELVCPPHRWYPTPMAPPMAAAVLERSVPTMSDLAAELAGSWPEAATSVGLVEGAGGVASPLAGDGDTRDLARAISADVVITVADPALGVINNLLLTRSWLGDLPVVVHLNRYDGSNLLHEANYRWLTDRAGFTVTTSIEELAANIRARHRSKTAPDL